MVQVSVTDKEKELESRYSTRSHIGKNLHRVQNTCRVRPQDEVSINYLHIGAKEIQKKNKNKEFGRNLSQNTSMKPTNP